MKRGKRGERRGKRSRLILPLAAIGALCALALAFALVQGYFGTSRAGAEADSAQAESPPAVNLVIGAADVNDAFYSAAGALSNFFATHTNDIRVNLTVQVTAGSVFNTQSIIAGDMDIALTQSAVQSAAVDGRGPWLAMAEQKSLRSICSLFTGALMLLVPDDSPIRTLADLAQKRVGVNTPGSGTNMNVRDLLDFPDHAEWAERVRRVEEATPVAISMLLEGELDAVFINSGHPSEAVIRLIRESRRPLRFVPIDQVQSFLRNFPEYVPHYIPLDIYPGIANTGNVRTIGTPTTLVTTDAMPDTIGYKLAKTLYEGFDELRALHPAFADINRADILVGLDAPLQEGCARYFADAGATGLPPGSAGGGVSVLLAGAQPTTKYYGLTRDIASRVNMGRQRHGVRVFETPSSGSVDNINNVASGEASFGIASGAALLDAARARGAWAGGVPQRKLRALARVGSDSYFLVAAADAIRDGRFIPGARIGVGLAGSGEAAVAESLLAQVPGAEQANLIRVDVVEGRRMMAERRLDATLFPVFHKSDSPPADLGQLLLATMRFSERPLLLLPLGTPADFLAASTFYETSITVPAAVPGGAERQFPALTTPVIFFTSVDIPRTLVRTVCAALLDDADDDEDGGGTDSARPDSFFSNLPVRLHDEMLSLAREKTGVELDPGPSPYETYLVVGSGPPDSDFSLAAGTLAMVVNQDKEYREPLLTVKPSLGGEDNIARLASGEFAVCLAESIKALDAYTGRGRWAERPMTNLRQLGVAYVSALVALVDERAPGSADLRDIADIEGQRVSLPGGYGVERDNAISLFSSSRLSDGLRAHSLFSANEPGGFTAGIELLRAGAVKALLFASGSHPNKDIARMLGGAPMRPLPVTGIHSLLVNDKGYSMTVIPTGAYGSAAADPADPGVPTLGIPVMLLATDALPEADAYRIARRLAERLEQAAGIYPAFETVTADMLPGDGAVPLHEGARRAYLDAGLLLDGEDRKTQNVSVSAIDPYSDGMKLATRLSGSIMRLFPSFRAHANVSNGIDVSCRLLLDGRADFAVFPSVSLFDPALAAQVADFRSVAWFGEERFACVTGADSGFDSFFDLSGGKIGLPGGHSLEEATFDALCRILSPNDPPSKVEINEHDFMAALLDGRLDAAILTVDRLEKWLDALNMTPDSARFKFIPFSPGLDPAAADRLTAMATGLTTHTYSLVGGRLLEVPVCRVANVMLSSRGLPPQFAKYMAWMLDPDNPDSGMGFSDMPFSGMAALSGGSGEPAVSAEAVAPVVLPAPWRGLPLPLHGGVEEYLRERAAE